jgi:hypothetical protein
MNLGGFLAGFAPGLISGENQLSAMRDRQQRNQLLALETRLRLQQLAEANQDQMTAASAIKSFLSPGGAPGGIPGGGIPGGGPIPLTPGVGALPGGAATGGPTPSPGGRLDFSALRDLATKVGFQGPAANTMAAIDMAESGGNPYAVNPADPGGSYGLSQINQGAHGPVAREAYGNAPRSMELAYDISRGGTDFSPWSTYKSGAYRKYLEDPGGAVAAGAGGKPDPETMQVAQATRQAIPPEVNGRMSIEGLWSAIEKANPGASDRAKYRVFEQMSRSLSPFFQQQFQQHQEQVRRQEHVADVAESERFQRESGDIAERRRIAGEGRAEARAGRQRQAAAGLKFDIYEDGDGTRFRLNPITGDARQLVGDQPYQIKDATKIRPVTAASSRASRTPTNIAAYDADGKQVYEGSATYEPGVGWIDPQTQQPIPGRVEITGKGGSGGGRGGSQTLRQLTSAREIMSDIQNIVQLPIATTGGLFSGRKQGPGLMDALKENFAQSLTTEDEELMNSSLSGLERELSIVVSPVYGGHWAADTFNGLRIKPGMAASTKVFNLARMRQTVDNALETIQNTDWVGKQQKDYAQYMRNELDKTIPWMPQDVIAFARQGRDDESFGDFIRRNRIGTGAGQPAQPGAAQQQQGQQAVPLPPGAQNDPDGTGYRRGNEVWVKRGNQLILTPGGTVTPP